MTSTAPDLRRPAACREAAPAVVVVGAGIVGASVAYHLARESVPVTLLEQAPAPAAGATGSSFAWIGDSGGDWPGGAQDMRPHVLADHRRLEAELPEFAVRWTGSLRWTGDTVPTTHPGQHLVGPDAIAVLEPHLRDPPDQAVHTPTDGGVDPVAMAGALVRDARAHGAQVVHGASVISIEPAAGVRTSAGFHPAPTVVLAAGVGTAALAGSLDLELGIGASPACLLRITAPSGLLKTIVAGPHFEAREVRDGELLVTMPYAGEPDDAVARNALNTLHRLQSAFDNGSACRLLGYHVSERPMPSAGPLVGYLTPDRSVYAAVTHSAVTLAPTVGRLIAEELTTGKPAGELRRCRPMSL